MKTSEQIDKIAPAFIKAWTELRSARLNRVNPFFKSKYADLDSVYEAIREPLTNNGLAVIQLCDNQGNEVVIETVLMHETGQFISSRLTMPIPKPDPQSVGAVISYARRYALSAICSITSQEDTDAEEAMNRKEDKHETGQQPQKKEEIKPDGPDSRKELLDLLAFYNNEDRDIMKKQLLELTSFTNKEGKRIKGKEEIKDLSDKQVLVTLAKLKREIDEAYGEYSSDSTPEPF